MIRGRTAADGSLVFVDTDESPHQVVGSVTTAGITGATGVDVTSDDITDAGAFGKEMLKTDSNGTAQLALGITALGSSIIEAVDGPTVRTAIGAGTSSLVLGTAAGTALVGNDPRLTAGAVGTASVRALVGGTATTASASDHTHTGLTADQVAATASVRTLGTGAQQAAAGTHTHTVSQVTDLTAAKLMTGAATAVNNSTATDVAGLVTNFNALLAALRTRGIITGS